MQFRKILVRALNANITSGGSADYGQFDVTRYSRFTGLASTVSSLTLRLRTGAASGSFQVSSTWAVNSGVSLLDVPNYAQYAYFDITAAQSTAFTLLVQGQPLP
jgi:hypothetical protein